MCSDREIKHIDDPQLAKAERVKISFRPENVSLDRMSSDNETDALPGKIHSLQYLGTQTLYTVDLFGQKMDILELGTVPRFGSGETVKVNFPTDNSSIFTD